MKHNGKTKAQLIKEMAEMRLPVEVKCFMVICNPTTGEERKA
jgi:hypothetical protein